MTSSAPEKLNPIGTERTRRCARCKRKIKRGNENYLDGRYYGTECIQIVLDQMNSQGRSE